MFLASYVCETTMICHQIKIDDNVILRMIISLSIQEVIRIYIHVAYK